MDTFIDAVQSMHPSLPRELAALIVRYIPGEPFVYRIYHEVLCKMMNPKIFSYRGVHEVMTPLLESKIGKSIQFFLEGYLKVECLYGRKRWSYKYELNEITGQILKDLFPSIEDDEFIISNSRMMGKIILEILFEFGRSDGTISSNTDLKTYIYSFIDPKRPKCTVTSISSFSEYDECHHVLVSLDIEPKKTKHEMRLQIADHLHNYRFLGSDELIELLQMRGIPLPAETYRRNQRAFIETIERYDRQKEIKTDIDVSQDEVSSIFKCVLR